MELVKKNVISIIAGVVALLAIVAMFWPIGGFYSTLRADAEKRKKVGDDIESLMKAPRVKPAVGDGPGEPLTEFPSRPIIASGQAVTAALRDQSGKLASEAVALNRQGHDVIVKGLLPTPDVTTISGFQTVYRQVTRPNGRPTPLPKGSSPALENIPDEILHSVAPPTDAEVRAELAKIWAEKYAFKITTREVPQPPPAPGQPALPPQLVPINQEQVQAEFRGDMKDRPEQFRRERATKYQMFMEPDALTLTQKIEQGATPSADDIWYAQLGLWVQQDLARGIRDVNAKSTQGVATSPVKHLMKITLKPDAAIYETAGAPGGVPAAAATPTDAPAGPVFTVSATGRVCNQMYDVVHSTLDLVVDEEFVQPLIEMLQRGRMITVIDASQFRLDNAAAAAQGYYYGSRPVVQLHLVCEHLFLREWTARGKDAPMPPSVQKLLGVQQAPPADPAAPAAGDAPVAAQ